MARRTGRPRASGREPTGLDTRTDILNAAARLFCTEGYGSTSTHALADAAGIRQASIYHYFAGKHEILLEILLGTVQPSLDTATLLLARSEAATARLWALCASDAQLLAGGEVNAGALYLIPELGDPRFDAFRERRAELESAYRSLIETAGAPQSTQVATALVLGLVESVILQRYRNPASIDAETAPSIADAALRVLGVDEASRMRGSVEGTRLLVEITRGAAEAG